MDDEDENRRGNGEALSQRKTKRLRRQTAGIVAGAVRDLRPKAPLEEIRRLVAVRCAAAGLPEPSPNALSAKIADVRRFETHPKMLALDRCYVESDIDGDGTEIATLHVAILHPPGRMVACRLIAGPPDAAIDAELLIDLQRASGPHPDVRVRLAATGHVEDRIRAALVEARLMPVARTSRWTGMEAKRILGSSLLPDKVRIRLPRNGVEAKWASPGTIARLNGHIGKMVEIDSSNGASATPAFGLAPSTLASTFVGSLWRVALRRP